jgi:uncharacterized membrane protein YfcA
MDMPELLSFDFAIFLFGTVVAAFVTGLSGFAFGMVAAAIWFYALPPPQASALIAAYALIVQGYAFWKLRRLLDWHRLMPFILGSALGIPLGVAALRWASPMYLRIGVGLLLVLFSLYNLARPQLPQMKQAGRIADGAVGVLNGVIGGATGLAGIVTVIWTSMRGWSRDEQRAVFQPTGVASFLMIIVAFGGIGIITVETIRLFLLGLPALAIGTWLGWMLYGKLDEGAFRRVVLILLLLSGAALTASAWR